MMIGATSRATGPHKRRASLLGRIMRSARGAAAIEFAIVAPVFITFLVGSFDIAQMAYAKVVLRGAVQQAARSTGLEDGNTDAADALVLGSIRPVLPNVTIASTRDSYFDFADIGRPEQFNDTNANNVCDPGETYVDENRSGHWEADIGVSGNGGAADVVVYTVKATYTPIFLTPFSTGTWGARRLTASAVRKNQPFADQMEYGSTAGTC